MEQNISHYIAISSGKGGVGKSTIAVNLAVSLAMQGNKVGLLDADIHGPSVPHMMGISGQKAEVKDNKLLPITAHGVKIVSMGLLVDETAPMVWRGPMLHKALRQFIEDVEWGELDILLIDMPPGTGDIALTIAQRVPLTGAVIVSTPQDIALLDVRKGIEMFRKVGVPALGIAENMSSYICPRCSHEEHIFGEQGAKIMAEKLGYDFLGEIPLHADIRILSDEGVPIVKQKPDSVCGVAYKDMAELVLNKIENVKALPLKKTGNIG